MSRLCMLQPNLCTGCTALNCWRWYACMRTTGNKEDCLRGENIRKPAKGMRFESSGRDGTGLVLENLSRPNLAVKAWYAAHPLRMMKPTVLHRNQPNAKMRTIAVMLLHAGLIRPALLSYRLRQDGYQFVHSPHMVRQTRFHRRGHTRVL
jgi:hypothetical protein